ncbi:zinc-dependent alcohol dehydrogenase [Amedibacillus sp. YH-ame10]
MNKTVKYGVLTKAHHAEVREMQLRELESGEVLVKQQACNICTTDYQQWLGLREHQGYPMAGGHESSGIVEAVADDVKEFKVGDRVSYCYAYCGDCKYCKIGRTDLCVERNTFQVIPGVKGDFGFATHAIRKAKFLVKTGKNLDPSAAGFIEPLATVLSAHERVEHRLGKTVLIIGAGTMGVINAQVARLHGAKVIISELMENKIAKAKSLGFDVVNPSKGDIKPQIESIIGVDRVDTVILGVGAKAAAEQAFDLVKEKDGEIMFFSAGYPAPELTVNGNDIHYRRLKLIGAFEAYIDNFYLAAQLLEFGLIDTQALVECTYPLSKIDEAFAHASEPGRYRVSVLLEEE